VKGKQALAFVRQRYNFPNGLGDLDRVERQRYFLTAAFRKLTTAGVILNPIKLQKLLTAVQSSLYMDNKLDPLDLARQLEDLSADNIVGETIPTDGFGTSDTGSSIVKVTPSKVQAFVTRLIGTTDDKLTTAKPVDPSKVTVDVFNAGTGIDHAAANNAAVLRQQGFPIGRVGSAAPAPNTMIEYSDGQQAQAKTLGQYVTGAQYRKVKGLQHLRLMLGADGLKAAAKAAPDKDPETAPATGSSDGANINPSDSESASSGTSTGTKSPKAIDAGCIN
jgi:hypothetical protein